MTDYSDIPENQIPNPGAKKINQKHIVRDGDICPEPVISYVEIRKWVFIKTPPSVPEGE